MSLKHSLIWLGIHTLPFWLFFLALISFCTRTVILVGSVVFLTRFTCCRIPWQDVSVSGCSSGTFPLLFSAHLLSNFVCQKMHKTLAPFKTFPEGHLAE